MSKTGRKEIHVRPGNPERPGASYFQGEYHFTIAVPDGLPAELLLYRRESREPDWIVPLPAEERTGLLSAVHVSLPGVKEIAYNYRINGKPVLDQRATALLRMPAEEGEPEEIRCLLSCADGAHTRPLELPYEDSVIYKLHVRGFTAGSGSGARKKGTFAGLREKIPYLKELGITTVMLMPVYEFQDTVRDGRKNYWGYAPGLYFAPKMSYSAHGDPAGEFAELVDAMHEAGLEVVPEFYFLPETDPNLVVDVLHYWRLRFRVDGFHLLGEGDWFAAVSADALLKKTKLFYAGFDAERLAGAKPPFFRQLGEYNPSFEAGIRCFLKGDEGCLEQAVWYLRRNSDQFASVNYLADQDGFTMTDLVTYGEKHNEENGEKNRDGSDQNHSWNCGVEGETKKQSIRKLRQRQLRNAFLMLLLAQGTPLIYAGDECGNTQGGNNNAWCQDNETGWVTWRKNAQEQKLHAFVRDAIAFRAAHPVLHQKQPLRLMDSAGYGWPDLSFHGKTAWFAPMEYRDRSVGMLYSGKYAKLADGTEDDDIFIGVNMYWKPERLALPDLPDGKQWILKADTALDAVFYPDGEEPEAERTEEKQLVLAPRSIQILIGRKTE